MEMVQGTTGTGLVSHCLEPLSYITIQFLLPLDLTVHPRHSAPRKSGLQTISRKHLKTRNTTNDPETERLLLQGIWQFCKQPFLDEF